jgi:hypothetical protein
MPPWCVRRSGWSKAALDRAVCLLLLVQGRREEEGRARWVKGRGRPGYIWCMGADTATQAARAPENCGPVRPRVGQYRAHAG